MFGSVDGKMMVNEERYELGSIFICRLCQLCDCIHIHVYVYGNVTETRRFVQGLTSVKLHSVHKPIYQLEVCLKRVRVYSLT